MFSLFTRREDKQRYDNVQGNNARYTIPYRDQGISKTPGIPPKSKQPAVEPPAVALHSGYA
jgi:hypothetical protein